MDAILRPTVLPPDHWQIQVSQNQDFLSPKTNPRKWNFSINQKSKTAYRWIMVNQFKITWKPQEKHVFSVHLFESQSNRTFFSVLFVRVFRRFCLFGLSVTHLWCVSTVNTSLQRSVLFGQVAILLVCRVCKMAYDFPYLWILTQ